MASMHRGAYGIALTGPLGDHPALRVLDRPRASLTITEPTAFELEQEPVFEPGHARIPLVDGSMLEAFDEGADTYRALLWGGPARALDDLVHPYLAPIAALVHRWRGVPALHGAAVATPYGAMALIGARGQGKTTTAAALVHERGLALLSDDLVVVEDGALLPGPLSLDLRPDGSELLGLEGKLVRGGGRLRSLAAPLPALDAGSLTLRLCVHLEFGDTTRIRPLPLSGRLGALGGQLYWPSVGAPAADLLGLAALPQLVLERPPGRPGLEAALDALLGALESSV